MAPIFLPPIHNNGQCFVYYNVRCSPFSPDNIGMVSWVIYYNQTLLNISAVLLRFMYITT